MDPFAIGDRIPDRNPNEMTEIIPSDDQTLTVKKKR